MLRVFKTKWMARFTCSEKLDDTRLFDAVIDAERGRIDADLGGGLIKQRVARAGGGKSGGYRMVVAYRREDRAVFLYGFAKNERDNIARDELKSLREIAAGLLDADEAGLAQAIRDGTLLEVAHGADEDTARQEPTG
jgi:hypothetical protein